MNHKHSRILNVRRWHAGPWAKGVWLLLALWLGFAPWVQADAPLKKLKVTTKRDGEITRFYVENLEATEITATFELELVNLKGSTNFPFTTIYPPKRVVEAFTLSPVQKNAPWKFNYTTRYTIGSVTAVHDNTCIYELPFASGSAYRVTQGYHGTYSHTGPEEFAIDWKMPAGTPIHAARDGIVAKVKDDSDKGGPFREFEGAANYILIKHADGTLANYAHLQKDGSLVKVGQRVRAGDQIGWSGNTGFSTGAHLHFSVFKTKSGSERESLPVLFSTDQGRGVTLAEGRTYRSADEALSVAGASVQRANSPKSESIWSRLPVLGRAQGGSQKIK